MGTEYHDLVENRNNVILLGDHLGDSEMAEGIPHKSTELKIAFLYEKVYFQIILRSILFITHCF